MKVTEAATFTACRQNNTKGLAPQVLLITHFVIFPELSEACPGTVQSLSRALQRLPGPDQLPISTLLRYSWMHSLASTSAAVTVAFRMICRLPEK